MMGAWLIALAMGLPWLGALSVGLAGDSRPRIQHILAVGFAVAAALAALGLLFFKSDAATLRIAAGSVFGDFTFTPDGLGVFLALIATVIGSLTVLFSVDYMRGEPQLGRYYALVLLFIGAMVGLVLTGSLLLLFIFWEVVAFCSYALISFESDNPKAVAGGIKALVITQIGGVGLLAGVLIAYSFLGTYEFSALLTRAHTLPPSALGVIAFGFLVAAAAKSAQVPFHTWLPDAMEAPTPVSALIHAATMVNAGIYLLARFYPVFAPVPGWKETVTIIGVLSAILAALMALVSWDLKRVLAYSTISQLGYMVYAVGVGAVFASQYHLLSHAVFKALLFLGAGAVIHAAGTRDLRQLGGLARQMPFVRNVFVIGALALAGVPILDGFWSKELILGSGWTNGPTWAAALMLGSVVLTALYTFRVVWLVFFAPAQAGQAEIHDAPRAMRIALLPLAVGAMTTWLLAGSLSVMLTNQSISTEQMVTEIVTAPMTVAALAATALGFSAWWWRARWQWAVTRMRWFVTLLNVGFGFEWLNRQAVALTQRLATWLCRTQTGQLNWNIAGIVGGLIMVLVALLWSNGQ
jgi:NADH-quinone oxidoreductase subunit L